MFRLKKRIKELEERNQPRHRLTLDDVNWNDEELAFRKDIHQRMKDANADHYFQVCNDEELERIRSQSGRATLITFLKIRGEQL